MERTRAARFVFDRDRNDFVAARGILRDIVARYMGRPAATIEFTYDAEGKPRLQRSTGDPPIFFNLSHSSGLAVYAFTIGREIGIDVEWIRRDVSADEIAARFFSRSEREALGAVAVDERSLAFFRCWTRKEAYIKARGGGLAIPLDSFDVSISAESSVRLVSADSDRWAIRSVALDETYVAAVAVEGTADDLELRDWRPLHGRGDEGGPDKMLVVTTSPASAF